MNASSQSGSRKKVTVALFVATFLAAIEGTIVGTAMPKITGELSGVQLYSWVISIYLLASVITTPIYGKLSDLYGRKTMFIIGASIFLSGSMLSGVAQSMSQLILFRGLQGLGAGALTTIPYTIIGDLYPFQQRAKVQGWMSSIWGIAGISGPLIGGLLVDYVSWRAIFYMNLPFGAVALYLLSVSLKDKVERKKKYIDYPGIITFAIGMFGLLYALSLVGGETGQQAGWAEVLPYFVMAVIFLSAFAWIEKRSPEPMIPFKLFRNRVISMANGISFLLCLVNVAVIFYLPLWFQGVEGYSATYSGILMIPLSIAWPLGSILAGNLIARLGLRAISLLAACLLLIGSAGFALVSNGTPVALLILFTFCAGMSFGLVLTSMTIAVTSSVGAEIRGAAVASNNFIRTLGQTLGITLFGLLLHTGEANDIDPVVLEASLHHIFVWVAWLCVGVLLLSFFVPKLEHEQNEPGQKAGAKQS